VKHHINIFAVIAVAVLLSLTACKQKQYISNEGYIFGTVYHITYLSSKDLQKGIDKELKKFDASLSMFNPESTLSHINQAGTDSFDLSKDPWANLVIERSLKISKLTDGAFDITVAPLVNAWGFGFERSANVTPEYIDSIKQFVGYQLITLNNGKLVKSDARIKLDASAVAKGYACDVVGDFLRSNGVYDFLVEIGGEMVLSGKNPHGNDWRVGINKPEDDSTSSNTEWEHKLTLTDKGVATSGNYRRFYEKNGKRYAHTIDPHTGYPVQHSLLSATVIANDCLTADALATSFMVMGIEKAMKIAESLPDVEALFIYDNGDSENKVVATSGIAAWQK